MITIAVEQPAKLSLIGSFDFMVASVPCYETADNNAGSRMRAAFRKTREDHARSLSR
jgi:hypothetical protein